MTPQKLDGSRLQQLIQKAKDGDREAFGIIYDSYFTQVYRFTALRVHEEVAEDLVAEIFVKAWEKLYTYQEKKNVPFGAWLFKIARNVVIDTYRTTKTWEEMPDEMPDQDEWNQADTKTRRAYVMRAVRKAMNKLPRRYNDVLSLAYMADLPHHEIARILRTSEGSVRILKFRALKKLEEHLPPDFRENV